MKYSGSISIVDDEGNAVYERELSADQIIEELVEHKETPEPESRSGSAAIAIATAQKEPSGFVKFIPTPKGMPKPCCGSKASKHKKDCPERKSPEDIEELIDRGTAAGVPVGDRRFKANKSPIEDRRVAENVVSPLKFIEIKQLQRQGYDSIAIAERKNLDVDEVDLVMGADAHSEYLRNRV